MNSSLSPKKTPIRVILPYALLGAGIFLFWFLRIYYWGITHEEPFSDMRQYDKIAKQLLQKKAIFGPNSFWARYRAPVLPLARAFQISISGDSLFGWQFFQTSLLFCGLLWCVHEIRKQTGKPWLGIAFFLFVAVNKSSIFWSYKIAMEGFTEVCIYFSIAIFLFSLRKRRHIYFLFSGLSIGMLSLHRQYFIVVVPLLALIIYLSGRKQKIQAFPISKAKEKQVISMVFLLAGIIVAWTPWVASNYMLYGEFLLFPTQAGRAFFFELGTQTVTLEDGSQIIVDTSSSFVEEPRRNFKNESEALRFHLRLVLRWIKQNPKLYLRLYQERLRRLFYNRRITLSKVSREKLFSGHINGILIDKFPTALFLGCVGLILLGLRYGVAMYIFAAFALIPIFMFTLIAGNPRYIEPMIPVILFANTVYISLFLDFCKRKLKGNKCA